ncbi:MAG: DEAD/DEAH box helicase family protein [Methylorubrum populi]
MSRELRPHQARIIEQLRRSLSTGHRRPMVQAPTGAGKTVVAGAIVKGALAKGKRVLFVVPAIALIDQTVRSFFAEGIEDIGVIQGNHPMTDGTKPVQVASIQTLQRREIPPFDIVVIDEAHRWFEMLGLWMAAPDWATVPFVGLSATPWTKGLGKHYDDLIRVTTTAELIAAGYLSPFRVYAPSHPDLSGVRTVAGDYHEGDLGEAMNKPELVADVVTTWRQRGENRPTFVFAVDRPHAKRLQAEFERAGVACGYIDAYTKPDEREALFRRFTAGELRVISSVGCLTTGVDLDVRCIVLARPTKSEMLFVQIIGRGLRTAPGKTDCLARGMLVLTDRGEVPIEDVTLADRVWDGVNFVHHAGAICKGVQPVITHDGITATPDHEVMTDEGSLSLAEARRLGLRIARTGVGGRPLRFADRHQRQDGRLDLELAGGSAVRPVFADAHGALSQSAEAARHGSVPPLQWPAAGHGAAMAVSAMPGAAGGFRRRRSRLRWPSGGLRPRPAPRRP